MWTAFAGRLTERWLAVVLTPSFAFWGGGVLAWLAGPGSIGRMEHWASGRTTAEILALFTIGFVLVAASGAAVARLTRFVIRAAEGYWPRVLAPLRRYLVRAHRSRFETMVGRWQVLAAITNPTPEQGEEFRRLDRLLRRSPTAPTRTMPTKLGNILRAAEDQPRAKYGLDAITCWPSLWLVLSDDSRREVSGAQANLNAGAGMLLWGLLFLVWTPWAWWAAPVGLVTATLAYLSMRLDAAIYADLVEALYDVHRMDLYRALRWPLPANPAEELVAGRRLTEYLWRGSSESHPAFTEPTTGGQHLAGEARPGADAIHGRYSE